MYQRNWADEAGYKVFRYQERVFLYRQNSGVLISAFLPRGDRMFWQQNQDVNASPWAKHFRGIGGEPEEFQAHVRALLQHCHCGHYALIGERCSFCLGEKKVYPEVKVSPEGSQPLPGDHVRFLSDTDSLISFGSLGVIDGLIDEKRDEYLVTFNPYGGHGYRDDNYVATSGGPAFYVPIAKMILTGRVEMRSFWRWMSYPCANGGYTYRAPVRVWDYKK